MTPERAAKLWPAALAGVLGAGIAVSLAFAWIAGRQPRDRLTVDTWTAGGAYNAAQRAQTEARTRGWDLTLRAQRSAGGVRIELAPTSVGAPLPPAPKVALRRERPGRADLDRPFELAPSDEGWVADVPLPLPGRWLLVARVGDGRAWVERRFALEVPP